MKIIEKDILTVESGIICQQVNCQGKMNSGLAKAIRDKWPHVYDDYYNYCNKFQHNFQLLGDFVESDILKDKLIVCSIFGQYNFGYDGGRYTDYGALNKAFYDYKHLITGGSLKLDIYFPFNFGACRGGGDFSIISKIIEFYFPDVIFCKFSE